MDRRMKQELDNHITGHYGEDQFRGVKEMDEYGPRCPKAGDRSEHPVDEDGHELEQQRWISIWAMPSASVLSGWNKDDGPEESHAEEDLDLAAMFFDGDWQLSLEMENGDQVVMCSICRNAFAVDQKDITHFTEISLNEAKWRG